METTLATLHPDIERIGLAPDGDDWHLVRVWMKDGRQVDLPLSNDIIVLMGDVPTIQPMMAQIFSLSLIEMLSRQKEA